MSVCVSHVEVRLTFFCQFLSSTYAKSTFLVELGTPACIIVAISTGRNQVTEATVKLTAPSGVEFNHDQASLVVEGKISSYYRTTLCGSSNFATQRMANWMHRRKTSSCQTYQPTKLYWYLFLTQMHPLSMQW